MCRIVSHAFECLDLIVSQIVDHLSMFFYVNHIKKSKKYTFMEIHSYKIISLCDAPWDHIRDHAIANYVTT